MSDQFPTWRQSREASAREYLVRLSEQADGKVTRMAELAGMNRQHMYHLLSRYSLARFSQNRGNKQWQALQSEAQV